jgi:hypothetical protein
MAAVDITNPQTWNRYAYVANNPLSFVDLFGLLCAVVQLHQVIYYPDNGQVISDTVVDEITVCSLGGDGPHVKPEPNEKPRNVKVTTNQQLTLQQQQCIENELAYAERARSDALNEAIQGIGTSTAAGMATEAARGAYAGFFGGEIVAGLETGGLSGPIGALGGAGIGAGIGGIYGVGAGITHALWTKVHYDYNLPFLPSTYASNLQKNIQQNCGVAVNLE